MLGGLSACGRTHLLRANPGHQELMPYTYSLAHSTRSTGAPFMRALFMDFPDDAKAAEIGDE
jgi:alpha-glucosidase (family GH31 glycosyl hydrolase)